MDSLSEFKGYEAQENWNQEGNGSIKDFVDSEEITSDGFRHALPASSAERTQDQQFRRSVRGQDQGRWRILLHTRSRLTPLTLRLWRKLWHAKQANIGFVP
ncbi:hypothetical protein PR048_013200 [Dryococelus australis]|uniref:Uncharacterized protein n=1 Tax=Dryococelus australis TaxID=614101 RepID=A0ABQ9HSC8_9NEOP|nr:hypothetical protein PR048_013200 [Dryococelus australis]